MGDDELSQICINPLFVWQGSRMLSAICQAWNCSKSQPTRAKFRFKLVRRQLYSVHLCAWLLCHGWCPPGPESRLWTLRGNQIRKVWLYEPVCINWFHQTTRKSHWFGVQKKEPSGDEVSAQRCKTCLELASLVLADQDFHLRNQVISMSLVLKIFKAEEKGWRATAAKCNDKRIELYDYIHQHPQLN